MKIFLYAFRGVMYALSTERSLRMHVCFAFYVIAAGFVTRLTGVEWAAVIACIGLVTSMECLNSAIEKLCDTIHPEWSVRIGRVKDMMAGAVLLCAAGAATAGSIIFFRAEKFSRAAQFVIENPYVAALIVLSLIPAFLFVFGGKKK